MILETRPSSDAQRKPFSPMKCLQSRKDLLSVWSKSFLASLSSTYFSVSPAGDKPPKLNLCPSKKKHDDQHGFNVVRDRSTWNLKPPGSNFNASSKIHAKPITSGFRSQSVFQISVGFAWILHCWQVVQPPLNGLALLILQDVHREDGDFFGAQLRQQGGVVPLL